MKVVSAQAVFVTEVPTSRKLSDFLKRLHGLHFVGDDGEGDGCRINSSSCPRRFLKAPLPVSAKERIGRAGLSLASIQTGMSEGGVDGKKKLSAHRVKKDCRIHKCKVGRNLVVRLLMAADCSGLSSVIRGDSFWRSRGREQFQVRPFFLAVLTAQRDELIFSSAVTKRCAMRGCSKRPTTSQERSSFAERGVIDRLGRS